MCDALPGNTLKYYATSSFGSAALPSCQLNNAGALLGSFQDLFELPEYVSYIAEYFYQFKSFLIKEISQNYPMIFVAILLSFFVAYVYLLLMTRLTGIMAYLTNSIPTIVFAGVGVLLSFMFHSSNNSFSVQQGMFGYASSSTMVINVVIVICAALCFLLAIVLFLMLVIVP